MSKKRRRSAFRKPSKAVLRAGRLACPVVAQCLRKIADSNTVWCTKNCNGVKESTVDNFTLGFAFDEAGGPSNNGETLDTCNFLGIPIFQDPVAAVAATQGGGLVLVGHNPANVLYGGMPLAVNTFPLIAKTNPSCAAAFNGGTCRESEQSTVTYFDNRHKLRIEWPQVGTTGVGAANALKRTHLAMHEVVYWVPDLSTIETNKLVATAAEAASTALIETNLRLQRKWLRRMYNAHFVPHPIADSTVQDLVDVTTGATTTPLVTFNETLGETVRISNNNLDSYPRDSSEFIAAGVMDARKEARPVWSRKKKFYRPKSNLGAMTENTSDFMCLSQLQTSRVTAGKKFHINKKMHWESTTDDATPDAAVRDVCSRGCYVYCQYWIIVTDVLHGTALAASILPFIAAAETKPGRCQQIRWQNV